MPNRANLVKIFTNALEKASIAASLANTKNTEKILFQYWKNAIHCMLIKNRVCPCQKNNPDECFLTFSQNEQIGLLNGKDISFQNIVNYFTQAKKIFIN